LAALLGRFIGHWWWCPGFGLWLLCGSRTFARRRCSSSPSPWFCSTPRRCLGRHGEPLWDQHCFPEWGRARASRSCSSSRLVFRMPGSASTKRTRYGFTWFYVVLRGFTWFYVVLRGFTVVLRGFTVVLRGFTHVGFGCVFLFGVFVFMFVFIVARHAFRRSIPRQAL